MLSDFNFIKSKNKIWVMCIGLALTHKLTSRGQRQIAIGVPESWKLAWSVKMVKSMAKTKLKLEINRHDSSTFWFLSFLSRAPGRTCLFTPTSDLQLLFPLLFLQLIQYLLYIFVQVNIYLLVGFTVKAVVGWPTQPFN